MFRHNMDKSSTLNFLISRLVVCYRGINPITLASKNPMQKGACHIWGEKWIRRIEASNHTSGRSECPRVSRPSGRTGTRGDERRFFAVPAPDLGPAGPALGRENCSSAALLADRDR